jgi:serine/threonine protein kinase/WD40 repeat protein
MADKVQQYTLTDRIGTGGTGTVRRARHSETKAEVAIKTLQSDIAREPATKKGLLALRKQAQALAPHENVARVLDVLESGDTLHIVMELAPGKSLESLISKKSRPMTQDAVINILNQTLRGAIAAHSKGLLHTNLKPSDIIISNAASEAKVKVSGFGVAKNFSNGTLLRAAGRTHTLPYIAPEQVRGELADERTDVYSLGAILYRMVTGKLPFASSERGAEARIRHAILNQPLPDIAETMPELNVSPHIVNIIRRALAKDRRERIPSMREFSRLVQKAQAELPSTKAALAAQSATASDSPSSTSTNPVSAVVAGALASAAAAVVPKALQFPPPPSAPVSEQVAFMEPVRTLSAPAELPKPSIQETSTPAQQPSPEPKVEEAAKEKSVWNMLTNPGNIATAAVAGAPTLVKSATELEIERRMQALRTEQERQTRANAEAQANETMPIDSVPISPATSIAATSNQAASSFSGANIQGSTQAEFRVQTPLSQYAPNAAGTGNAGKQEKKKRSLVPWLVVGAIALGGGIYYVALKNGKDGKGGTATGSAKQQALSQEEIEKKYDSLAAGSPKSPDSAISAQQTSEATSTTDTPATTPSATSEPVASAQKEQVPNAQEANTPTAQESVPSATQVIKPSSSKMETEKTSKADKADKSEMANKADRANAVPEKALPKALQAASELKATKEPKAIKEPKIATQPKTQKEKPAAVTAPERTSPASSLSGSKSGSKSVPSALSSINTDTPPSEQASALERKKSKHTTTAPKVKTPFTTAQDGQKSLPKNLKNLKSVNADTAKSGSLTSFNAATEAEREATRQKIRQKYSGHLSKKQTKAEAKAETKAEANKLAANTSSTVAPSASDGGKQVPSALKNFSSQKTKTNREDNYTPPTNPVDATSEIDPSTTALNNASRKAIGMEPYLILRGHVGNVRSVSFSPDGKLIASGSDDKTVKIWDAATGTIQRSLRGHANGVTSVFFSPDSKFVISSGKDKTVRIWDATTGDAIQRSPGVSCEGSPAAFSPDGSFIATANNRNINITKVQK